MINEAKLIVENLETKRNLNSSIRMCRQNKQVLNDNDQLNDLWDVPSLNIAIKYLVSAIWCWKWLEISGSEKQKNFDPAIWIQFYHQDLDNFYNFSFIWYIFFYDKKTQNRLL